MTKKKRPVDLRCSRRKSKVGGQLGTTVRERQELEISSIRSDLEGCREDERDPGEKKQFEDVGSQGKKGLENKDSQRAGEAGQWGWIHVTQKRRSGGK